MAKHKTIKCRATTGEKCQVRHNFTVEEYKDLTKELTRNMELADEKEENVKAHTAVAKAEIKSLKAVIVEMRNKLSGGYEMREVDALVEFNRKKGTKRYYRHEIGAPHHGDFIKEAQMTEEDYALLPLEQAEPKADEPVGEGTQPEQLA